jgi:hypothetical protein
MFQSPIGPFYSVYFLKIYLYRAFGSKLPRIFFLQRKSTTELRMRKYAYVGMSRTNSIRVTEPRTGSIADTGNIAQLRHAYRFESEKLGPKTDISKIVAFLRAI